MVLADLGTKISGAINAMAQAVVIDDDAINKMTNTISLALLQGASHRPSWRRGLMGVFVEIVRSDEMF